MFVHTIEWDVALAEIIQEAKISIWIVLTERTEVISQHGHIYFRIKIELHPKLKRSYRIWYIKWQKKNSSVDAKLSVELHCIHHSADAKPQHAKLNEIVQIQRENSTIESLTLWSMKECG